MKKTHKITSTGASLVFNMLISLREKVKEAFRLEEVEVSFDEKSNGYSYRKISNK